MPSNRASERGVEPWKDAQISPGICIIPSVGMGEFGSLQGWIQHVPGGGLSHFGGLVRRGYRPLRGEGGPARTHTSYIKRESH